MFHKTFDSNNNGFLHSGLKVTVYPCSCGGRYIRRQNDKGVFWGCNNYPDCRNAVPDK
ncbi:topoisomerase DNA-binding C4 zinc finger domain-containing protein, partial [Salmonella enterica subsp. enterica serovar Anatum]|nr:topoisomerase DNA-binding C4 zinc finger domain-containing protein [Salmonella enterica subsp. enterica serovar Anatum]